MKPIYNINTHVKALLHMLEYVEPKPIDIGDEPYRVASICPAQWALSTKKVSYIHLDEEYFCTNGQNVHPWCAICRTFIGMTPDYDSGYCCPCYCMPESVSIKKTWIALEEGGFI